MKKGIYLLAAIFVCVLTIGCGGSKTASKETAVKVLCSGSKYQTDKKFFRASAVGASADMAVAKKKALTDVRAQLAAILGSRIRTVTEDYVSSWQQEDGKRRFEELTRITVDEELNGVRVICEQTVKAPDGQYKVYMAAELSKQEVMETVAARARSDEKLKSTFEYERYKKSFDEEMGR